MKPTSLIFLALSVVLLIGGFLTCSIAESMAKSRGISIFDQKINDEGDAVYVYNLSDESITKLSLVFSDVDVTVIGTENESYIEMKNFRVNDYRTTLSGSSVTVDGTVSFFSSLIDMSGGGVQFKGLRYFFLEKPDPDRPRSVTVYIAENSGLKNLSVTSTKGTVTCRDLPNAVDYSVNAVDADIRFDRINTISVAELKTTNGNITVKGSEIATLTASIENGNFSVDADGAYSSDLTTYNLVTAEGIVTYNGVVSKETPSELKITSPAPKCLIKATVTKGNITVTDDNDTAEPPAVDPAPAQ